MPKVDLELVQQVLERNQLERTRVSSILKEILQQIAEDEAAREEDAGDPPPKKTFAVTVFDPEGRLRGQELHGWVFQIPETEGPHIIADRLAQGADEYNSTKRARRRKASSFPSACEFVPPAILRQYHIWVKTRQPIQIFPVGEALPGVSGSIRDI